MKMIMLTTMLIIIMAFLTTITTLSNGFSVSKSIRRLNILNCTHRPSDKSSLIRLRNKTTPQILTIMLPRCLCNIN